MTVMVIIPAMNHSVILSKSLMPPLQVAHTQSASGVYGCGRYMANVNWLKVPKYPGVAVADMDFAASYKMSVYLPMGSWCVAVAW